MNEFNSYSTFYAAFKLDILSTLWLIRIFKDIGDKTEQPRHILGV